MSDQGAALPSGAKLRRPEHVLSRELEGETVILSVTDERYFGLDEVGTRFWQLLGEETTFGAAVDALLDEYDVAPTELIADLTVLVAELEKHGLLVVDDS